MITVTFLDGGPVTLGPAQAKALGARIKGLRNSGLSDEEIAAKVGIARHAVRRLAGSGAKINGDKEASTAKAASASARPKGSVSARESGKRKGAPEGAASEASGRAGGLESEELKAARASARPKGREAKPSERPGGLALATSPDGLQKIAALDSIKAASPKGRRPYLAEIPLTQLRVETDYQREIGRLGRTTIRAIVRDFRWARFGPLIVAPIHADGALARSGENLFAIIDGQHRATALATLGIATAPCIVHEIDKAARADAYAAINTCVTAMTTQAKFYARLAAGDGAAIEAKRVCDRLGVRILKYSAPASQIGGRDCCAAGALIRVQRRFGGEALEAALAAILGAPDFAPGNLKSLAIETLAVLIAGDTELMKRRADLACALAGFDFDAARDAAWRQARVTGEKTPDLVAAACRAHLDKRLGAARQARTQTGRAGGKRKGAPEGAASEASGHAGGLNAK